jgi:hypothetical protein
MNQFMTAVEKIAAMQAEEFFLACRNHADREALRRILNRQGGEPPRPDDQWPESNAPSAAQIGSLPGRNPRFHTFTETAKLCPFAGKNPSGVQNSTKGPASETFDRTARPPHGSNFTGTCTSYPARLS